MGHEADQAVERNDSVDQPELFQTEPDLIALYSPVMGSGKSEVAKVLVEEYGFTLVKFAGCLKEMTRVFLGYIGFDPEEMIEGSLKEEPIPGWGDLTPRYLMQTLGTEWGREVINKDLWIKVAHAQITSLRSRGHPVVIDDMRFPNELALIKQLGGQTVRIIRPGADYTGMTKHSSEMALSSEVLDFVIYNDGTLDQLRSKVRASMGYL